MEVERERREVCIGGGGGGKGGDEYMGKGVRTLCEHTGVFSYFFFLVIVFFEVLLCYSCCCCTRRDTLDLENVDLPENHPFAVKKDISDGRWYPRDGTCCVVNKRYIKGVFVC